LEVKEELQVFLSFETKRNETSLTQCHSGQRSLCTYFFESQDLNIPARMKGKRKPEEKDKNKLSIIFKSFDDVYLMFIIDDVY